MRWFGKQQAPSEDPDKALYVHLALDGGIFVIRGGTGEQLWTDRAGLQRELDELKERRGRLIYSREAPDLDPPKQVEETFQLIVESKPATIQLLDRPHPEALVPADERRTLLKDEPA